METTMTFRRSLGIALVTAALVLPGCASMKKTPATTAAGEKTFKDPNAAFDAVLAACRANDEAGLIAIFGPQAQAAISTSNPEANRERCQRLVSAAGKMTRFDPAGPNAVQVVVGTDDFPFPIPLVRADEAWHFDTAAGLIEVRKRKIGADELEAIDVCRDWAVVQKSGGDPLKALGDPASPPADAAWSGYLFRVLKVPGVRSGKAKPLGVVAYPAAYGVSGIMTFVVGTDGVVYQKDLGPQTEATATAMTTIEPDSTWRRVGG